MAADVPQLSDEAEAVAEAEAEAEAEAVDVAEAEAEAEAEAGAYYRCVAARTFPKTVYCSSR